MPHILARGTCEFNAVGTCESIFAPKIATKLAVKGRRSRAAALAISVASRSCAAVGRVLVTTSKTTGNKMPITKVCICKIHESICIINCLHRRFVELEVCSIANGCCTCRQYKPFKIIKILNAWRSGAPLKLNCSLVIFCTFEEA